MSADDWKGVISLYKGRVEEELGRPFPQDPKEQLWGAIGAVFSSWMNPRAVTYRRIHNIPQSWGTAVNVQAMVFGNMGETSATGVAFTRNPSTGEKALYGEFLVNAQGEDVVAGIRTPQNITEAARLEGGSDKPSLEKLMPEPSANSPTSPTGWKPITATCRTSNSPSRRASSGCCRRARASAPPRPPSRSPSTWPARA
jgi:pyruvate, orthophosphate dikinase